MFQPSHLLRMSWTASQWPLVRLLWIGNTETECLLSKLPKDIIRIIQSHCLKQHYAPRERDNFTDFRRLETLANGRGLHDLVYEAARATGTLFEVMLANVVLSGGNTMFPNFAERLNFELQMLAPSTTRISVTAAPERKQFAWIGGSILGSLSIMATQWMRKEDYDEYGPRFVNWRVRLVRDFVQ